MNVERKYIDLKDLKVSDEGPGTIEGYRSVFGEIDEGGDIVLKGAFADGLSEYLEAGFSAHSHDWKFTEAVGYPVDSYEDDYGWFVKSEFHTTKTAQDARTIANERKKAGKKVGFSFGYIPLEYEYIDAKNFKEKLPLYVKTDRLPFNLIKAQKFSRIRVLKKVEAPEDSLVLAGMNKLAAATAVKTESGGLPFGTVEINGNIIPTGGYGCHTCPAQFKKIEEAAEHGKVCRAANAKTLKTKGMLAEEMAEAEPSFWRVESAYCRLIRKIAESAKNAEVIGNEFDWQGRVDAASSELATEAATASKQQIQIYLEGTDDEFYLKGMPESESFESFDKAASAALKKFIENMQRNHEARTKEGRVLSTSNRATVQKCKDSLTELMGDLDALLAMSEPKPKDKEIDVDSLRTQSLRARSSALLAGIS